MELHKFLADAFGFDVVVWAGGRTGSVELAQLGMDVGG